jgi:hypothetical protein
MTSEDRRRAEEGLVALRSEEAKLSYKHIEELSPEDRMERIRAELARIEWLMERQRRRNMIQRSDSFERYQSRKSLGQDEAFETKGLVPAPWRSLQASI